MNDDEFSIYRRLFGPVMDFHPGAPPRPLCIGCNKHPSEIEEYCDEEVTDGMTPDDYVRSEEGTYNPENGHFLCTGCYCDAGMPSSPRGWQAP